jgi:carbamate kinase
MGPKVESAAYYAKALGRKALITDVDHLKEALSGIAGTWVVP